MMRNMTSWTKSQAHATQDPDGMIWSEPHHWKNSKWDGIQFNATGKTKQETCKFLRPSQTHVARGIREKFYQVNPFKDNINPTIPEKGNFVELSPRLDNFQDVPDKGKGPKKKTTSYKGPDTHGHCPSYRITLRESTNNESEQTVDSVDCNTLICLHLATHRVSSYGTHGVVTHSQKIRFSAHRTSCY